MKHFKTSNSILAAFVAACLLVTVPAMGQDKHRTFSEIEIVQDQIEAMYGNAYDIMEQHPNVTYEFTYGDAGELLSVEIQGVSDNQMRDKLEMYMLDIETLKNKIENLSNRIGTYYVTETSPKPQMGHLDFYKQLQANLSYPQEALDRGVEGVIYAKFVVNDEGKINRVFCTEDIDTIHDVALSKMMKETREAILASSGKWIPAKVGGVPVSQWVVIPVQFDLKKKYFMPIW